MSTPRKATYGYEQLANRIEQVLGERPSGSTLRAAAAQARRTHSTQTRPRLTAGMPAPLPASSRTALAAFAVDEVETWLKHHPRLQWNRALSQTRAELNRGADVDQVVARALVRGLSWRTITTVLIEHDGRPRSTAGVHKRYQHLTRQRG